MTKPASRWRTLLAALAWAVATVCGVVAVRLGVERFLWPTSSQPTFNSLGGMVNPALVGMVPSLPAPVPLGLWTSLGSLTGLWVGFMTGVRSRTLIGWVAAPTLGMAIPVLDYFAGTVLASCGWPIRFALLFPTSGLLAGWMLGWIQPSQRRAIAVLVALVALDALGRWLGTGFDLPPIPRVFAADAWVWVMSTGPLAIAIVLAAGRRAPPAESPGHPAWTRVSWGWTSLAVLLFLAGLAGADGLSRSRVEAVQFSVVSPLPDGSTSLRQWDDDVVAWTLRDRGIHWRFRFHTPPPGRNFGGAYCKYDANLRVGCLIGADPTMHSIAVGTVVDRAGGRIPVRILTEPWVNDGSLILILVDTPADLEAHEVFLTPDPLRDHQVRIGRRRYVQVARARELEPIAAEFAAAIARRDAGGPVELAGEGPIHLVDLVRRFGPLQPQLREAHPRMRATEPGSSQLVRVVIESDGMARVLIVPGTRDLWFDAWITAPGQDPSATGVWLDRFWINHQGRVIGDVHELLPDGHPALEWRFEIRSRWIEIHLEDAPTLLVDLGAEAEAIASRSATKPR